MFRRKMKRCHDAPSQWCGYYPLVYGVVYTSMCCTTVLTANNKCISKISNTTLSKNRDRCFYCCPCCDCFNRRKQIDYHPLNRPSFLPPHTPTPTLHFRSKSP